MLKRDIEDLSEQKNLYKIKHEEAKRRSRELMIAIDDFKRRFVQQSR